MRTLSPSGETFIKLRESYSLTPHWDAVAGVWDIGYGHRFKPGEPRVAITMVECDALFHIDSLYYSQEVDRMVRVPTTAQQFDGLVSFAYNAGWQALEHSGKLLPAVNGAQWDKAVVALLEWNRSGGRKVRGLCSRRFDEAMIIAYADYSQC